VPRQRDHTLIMGGAASLHAVSRVVRGAPAKMRSGPRRTVRLHCLFGGNQRAGEERRGQGASKPGAPDGIAEITFIPRGAGLFRQVDTIPTTRPFLASARSLDRTEGRGGNPSRRLTTGIAHHHGYADPESVSRSQQPSENANAPTGKYSQVPEHSALVNRGVSCYVSVGACDE
jgi:hypothetical protein